MKQLPESSYAYTPDMSSQEAVRHILQSLFVTMQANEAGVILDIAPLFLHDYRIAIRRMRSALTQIRGVLPTEQQRFFCAEFAWLGEVTTPLRDLDVALLDFERYQQMLDRSIRPDLEPLHRYLEKRRAMARSALVRSLQSARYHTLCREWQLFLAGEWPLEEMPAGAKKPVLYMACRNIDRLTRQVLHEIGHISSESSAESLHLLRKSCKKLRYLLEFFRSLFPHRKIDRLLASLKRIQDQLGLSQDLSVQQHTVQLICIEMQQSGDLTVETTEAIERVMEVMAQRRLPDTLAACLQSFSSHGNRRRIKRLFRTKHRCKL